MANSRSARKRIRKTARQTALNKRYRTRLSALKKSFKQALNSENTDEAKKLIPKYFSALDKSAKKNIIHKNKARRVKSLISQKVSA